MADRDHHVADHDVPDAATADRTRDIAPLIRVTKGDPTDEELAALVAVVSSLGAAAAAEETSDAVRRSEWSAHHRKVRGPHVHGPGAWRTTVFPR
jgi:hypothetical protein